MLLTSPFSTCLRDEFAYAAQASAALCMVVGALMLLRCVAVILATSSCGRKLILFVCRNLYMLDIESCL